ncbi:MAG: nucleotidyltransferase family protein [Mariprofundaceae bacterium]
MKDYQSENLIFRAMHEGMDGLLFPMIMPLDLSDSVLDAYQSRLREKQGDYLRIRNVCSQVLSTLNAVNIQVVCMRGLAVSERLYEKSAYLRPQSDIDLLLQEDQLMDAKQALWDLGFRPDHAYKHIFVRGDMSLDLHTEPLGIERIQAWQYLTPLRAPDFFNTAIDGELAGEKALLIAPEVELPYLCFHALKHSFERLIWLYDIALLAQKIDANDGWDKVVAGMREYGLERPCFYALSYVKSHLNAPVPEKIIEEIKPKMNFIERRLLARFMDHEIIPYLAERLFARMMPDFSHRLAFWRETVYPRYEVRKQMADGGCVKCSFIRKRLRQVGKAIWLFFKEGLSLLRVG